MSHVGSWLGRSEGGQGSVGFGQRERAGLGDVRIGTDLSCGVFSVRQQVPLVFFSQLHARTHTQTHKHTCTAVLIFDARLNDLGLNGYNLISQNF